jgi:hypothetical protein
MAVLIGFTLNQCPLYPKIGFVMMVKNTNPPLCSLAMVTHVTRLKFIQFFEGITNHEESNSSWVGPQLVQKYFVGEVNVCMLEVVASCQTISRGTKVSQITNSKSLQSFERLLHNAFVTSRHHGKPVEWVWGETNTFHP